MSNRSPQASAGVGATNAGDWAIENAKQLRMTVGPDTVPNLMRKYARAGARDDEVSPAVGGRKKEEGLEREGGKKYEGDIHEIDSYVDSALRDRSLLPCSSSACTAWRRQYGAPTRTAVSMSSAR